MPPKNERTAKSATRFTPTTPHASSKVGSGAAKPTSPSNPPRQMPGQPRASPGPAGVSAGGETPEQRVARLRAAHEAARNAKVSQFDSFLARARPIFDSVHRITVVGLVGLTAVAGVMTAYTAYDMLRYNRARKIEFNEAQKKMSAESMEAARLAYMRGDATAEQLAMVEEANARPEGFQLPSILSAPRPIKSPAADEESATAGAASSSQSAENKSSLWGFFQSGSKKEEGETAAEQQPQRSLEEKRAMLEQAKAAFEQEKENQRKGGPLDRIGTESETVGTTSPKDATQPKKKGWFW